MKQHTCAYRRNLWRWSKRICTCSVANDCRCIIYHIPIIAAKCCHTTIMIVLCTFGHSTFLRRIDIVTSARFGDTTTAVRMTIPSDRPFVANVARAREARSVIGMHYIADNLWKKQQENNHFLRILSKDNLTTSSPANILHHALFVLLHTCAGRISGAGQGVSALSTL